MKPTKLQNFAGWFRYYRTQQITVRGLGRWESFWRAFDRTLDDLEEELKDRRKK